MLQVGATGINQPTNNRRVMGWWMDLLTTYIHHSELQVITTLLQMSTLHKSLYATPFPACSVFTSHSLVTASNSRDSSVSRAQVLLSQPPVQKSRISQLPTINFGTRLTFRHEPQKETPFLLIYSNNTSIVACVFVAVVTVYRSSCLAIIRLLLTCLPAATKQRMFFLEVVA
jgi:hypothetical protein